MKTFEAALIGTALAALAVSAQASTELAQKYSCSACHAVDRKLVGPSFQDVAKKYASQADAAAVLSASIRSGGVGRWGPVPMPAQPAIADAELQALTAWVLRGGK